MSVFTSQIQNKPWLPQVTLLAAVLGALLALSLKTQDRIRGENLPNMRPGQLAAAYKEMNQTAIDQKRKIGELQANLVKYQKVATADTDTSKLLSADLQKANVAAGLVAVTGPGVLVTLRDSKNQPPRPQGLSDEAYIDFAKDYIIHDRDIQLVVNELKAAGAEAITINDQRVVSMTAIRCVGPTVTVNNVTTNGSPVQIRAVGDPATLSSSLFIANGVAAQFGLVDPAMFSLDKVKEQTLPAFAGANPLRFAKPAQDATAEQAQKRSETAANTKIAPDSAAH